MFPLLNRAKTVLREIISKKYDFLCDGEALKVFRIYRCHPVYEENFLFFFNSALFRVDPEVEGKGLDYEHAVLAVARLAKFHAVSYAYRYVGRGGGVDTGSHEDGTTGRMGNL